MPMNVLITGSTGLIGSALVSSLSSQGHRVTPLVRRPPQSQEIPWDPEKRILVPNRIEGFDAVIHLAGDPIAKGRWTPQKKEKIRRSRVEGTQFLAETLRGLKNPPRIFVCASAIGIYGHRGNEPLREESPPGTGFLAEVGQAWEKATTPAVQRGIRTVSTRFGIVLSPKGGALQMMLPIFKIGLGGILGNGQPYMSWVSIEDVVGALQHILLTDSLRGPVNVVSPHPVTNREFTKTLGKVLRRPTIFPVPAFVVRLAFGELADEALLASTRVEPARLLQTGYRFHHPDLEGALQALLC